MYIEKFELNFFSSADEKLGQKQKCCVYNLFSVVNKIYKKQIKIAKTKIQNFFKFNLKYYNNFKKKLYRHI